MIAHLQSVSTRSHLLLSRQGFIGPNQHLLEEINNPEQPSAFGRSWKTIVLDYPELA